MATVNNTNYVEIVNTPQEQNDDLAPRLGTAPDLLLHLGLCIAVSSSREISRVRLPPTAPAGPGLSTNLIQIANEGSNAFLGAYKDLLSISVASEELCRDNGRLDQLAYLITNGATKSSKDMVYRWVMDCVSTCENSGSHTERNFDNWRVTVEAVQRAVHQAKDVNEWNLGVTEVEKNVAVNSIDSNKEQISSAMEEVAFAVQQHEARRQTYDKRTNAHESRVSEQLEEYMFNPFLAAIKRPFKWGSGTSAIEEASELRLEAQRDVHNALRELTKRRQQEMELRLQAKRILANIADYEHKEMRLKNIGTTIGEVCVLLVALGNDVRTLLATFANIGKEIARIVMTRKDIEEPGGINLGFTKINPFKKKGTLKQPNKKDKALMDIIFLDRIHQMKQVCLGIQVSANLYACIINDVINYGFSEAIRVSYENLGESTPSKIITERKKMMARWHEEAGRICSAKNQEAKKTLESKLQLMSRSSTRASYPGFMSSNPGNAFPNSPPPYATGYPPQGFPQQGFPQQGFPPHGFLPQQYPPQAYPQPGYSQEAYPPQNYPQQGNPPHPFPAQPFPPSESHPGVGGRVFVASPSGQSREAFEI